MKINFTDPSTIKANRAYSQALRQQAAQPLQGGYAGRVYVPPSWTQGANKMLQAALAGSTERNATKAQESNRVARRDAMARALAGDKTAFDDPAMADVQEARLMAQLQQQYAPPKAPGKLIEDPNNPGNWIPNPAMVAYENQTRAPQKPVAIYDPSSPTGTKMVAPSEAIGKAGAKRHPLVQVGNDKLTPEEKAAAADKEAWNEHYRGTVMGVMDAGLKASDDIAGVERALTLLENVDTGTFEESKLAAQKFFKSIGISVDDKKIADAEELRKFLGDQIMARVAQTKGAVSNKEMELFKQYSANYGNTTEGNRNILNFAKAVITRNMEQSKIAQQMEAEGKTTREIYRALEQYKEENSVASILKEVSTPMPDNPDDVFKAADKILENI